MRCERSSRAGGADSRRSPSAARRTIFRDGWHRSTADRRRHRADAEFSALAARLESLSPLAVLARGYAVCWTDDRSAIIRSADAVSEGDAVHLTLSRGELDCRVEKRLVDPEAPDVDPQT